MKAVRSKKFEKLVKDGLGREFLREFLIEREKGKSIFTIKVKNKKYKIKKLG